MLEPVHFSDLKETLYHKLNRQVTSHDLISYALYPKVYLEYAEVQEMFGDVSVLDTPTFLYGMRLGEEIEVEIEQGKTLIVKLVSIGEPNIEGKRTLYFELNGQPREVVIKDENIKTAIAAKPKADRTNANHIGATMPGTVIKVLVEKGERVNKGDHLMITEAMKMETTVQAPRSGIVEHIHVANGEGIESGDLLLEMNE